MKTTIRDIAQDTNLSLATISKYLNGKNISKHNACLIKKSIEKLGYVPNKAASSLRSKKTSTIAILLSRLGEPFWGSICNSIEEFLQANGYYTIIRPYESAKENKLELYRQILNSQVDGFIVIIDRRDNHELLELLKQETRPIVFVDELPFLDNIDIITSTNFEGAYEMTNYLIQKGHKRIGTIGYEPDGYHTFAERIAGFRKACEENGIAIEDQITLYTNRNFYNTASLIEELYGTPNPPSALFVLGNYHTLVAIQQLKKMQLSFPKNLSFAAFDDDPMFFALKPPITVIRQNMDELGYQAASLLLRRISGDYEDFPQKTLIDTQFIERASVGSLTPKCIV